MRLKFELLPDNGNVTNYGWVVCSNNANPYNGEQLKLCDQMGGGNIDKVLSIPSPYARLHLTETAFQEAIKTEFSDLPKVYKRAISHCLDVFQLFYLAGKGEVDLVSEKISVEKYIYENKDTLHNSGINENLSIYMGSLQFYRENYKGEFGGRDVFKNFYVVKKRVGDAKRLIAMTSPFSIFATPDDIAEDCEIKLSNSARSRILFSQNEFDKANNVLWSGIEDRSDEDGGKFVKFVCSIARVLNGRGESNSFCEYIEKKAKSIYVDLGPDTYQKEFPQFSKDGEVGELVRVDDTNLKKVDLLPCGYDTYLFDNFLNPAEGIDIERLKEESNPDHARYIAEFNKAIDQRTNIFDGASNPNKLCWLTADDLMEDVIYVPNQKINEDLYFSKNGVIIPFTKKFFQLFNLFDGDGRLTSKVDEWVDVKFDEVQEREYVDKIYDITLILPSASKEDKKVRITKRYSEHRGQVKNIDIDFGIFPFSQVTEKSHHEGPDNFYRVMLYQSSDSSTALDLYKDIKLYAKDSEGLLVDEVVSENSDGKFHVQKKQTLGKVYHPTLNDNLYYLSLESFYWTPNSNTPNYRDVRFNFVEVKMGNSKFVLLPRFTVHDGSLNTKKNDIAVDLGTSNTYVAWGSYSKDKSGWCHDFRDEDTILLGKLCKDNDKLDYYKKGVHQWAEFIPSVFEENGAHFPIATSLYYMVHNVSDLMLNRDADANDAPLVSLFSMNIPFRADVQGPRTIENDDVDKKVNNFKWFPSKTRANERMYENAFKLFVDQICFMLRSKLIALNSNYKNVKLAWTFPLSGESKTYSAIWEMAYKKYFGVIDTNRNINNLYCFTESETPIESSVNTRNEVGWKMGIDIGGGSSDLIIYYKESSANSNEIKLATSFTYAGKCLFGNNIQNKNNIWYKALKNYVLNGSQGSVEGISTAILHVDDDSTNISEVMDYVFTQLLPTSSHDNIISTLLNDQRIRCVSTFHLAALVWEVARIVKAQFADDKVVLNKELNIVLSGNGSNLVLLPFKNGVGQQTQDQLIDVFFKVVFYHVYQNEHIGSGKRDFNINSGLKVEKLKNPKKATANGAIALMADEEVRKRITDNNVSTATQYAYIPFLGKNRKKSNEIAFDGVPSASPVSTSATSDGGAFGFDLASMTIGASSAPQEVAQQAAPATEPQDGGIPDNIQCTIDEIDTYREFIKQELNDFFDFFFTQNKLKPFVGWDVSPLKARIIDGNLDMYINKAKAEIRGANNRADINTSVFLEVVSLIINDMIKELAK